MLDATVNDDGLPDPPGTVSVTWSKISGLGSVSFDDASAIDTTASFSQVGIYVLQLMASDGIETTIDDVMITVEIPLTVESRLSASVDDAEESSSGNVSVSSSDLELVEDSSTQIVGMRFNDIDIPQRPHVHLVIRQYYG